MLCQRMPLKPVLKHHPVRQNLFFCILVFILEYYVNLAGICPYIVCIMLRDLCLG